LNKWDVSSVEQTCDMFEDAVSLEPEYYPALIEIDSD